MSRLSIRLEESVAILFVLTITVVAATTTTINNALPPAQSTAVACTFSVLRTRTGYRLIAHYLSIPRGSDPQRTALNYLARPGGPLPRGTTLQSLSLDSRGVLTLRFSSELGTFSGGSTREGLALAALSATVARFPGAKSFRLIAGGKPLRTLGGHADLTEPYPASTVLPAEFR